MYTTMSQIRRNNPVFMINYLKNWGDREMRKNYFAKIVKYIKDVYNLEEGLRNLQDKRINPTYKTDKIVLPVLFGFILRIISFNELNYMIKNNEFKNVLPKGCKLPGIDSIRDTLKVIDISGIRNMLKNCIVKTRENKVFDNGTIDGLVVCAIDGTQTFNSEKKKCENCLTTIKNAKNEYRNHHSNVVISTVGNAGVKLVVDFQPYRALVDKPSKNEGELTAAKRLIERVSNDHKGFVDVIVYDAIACNSEWINTCIDAKIDTVVRVKKNNINSIEEVKYRVNKLAPAEIWQNYEGYKSVEVYEGYFKMNNVGPELRFIKFHQRKQNNKRTQIMIITTSMNLEPNTIYKIIKARQDIENSIFHKLKTECGLSHCYVHGGNAIEAVLCLIFLASNYLELFYCRRIRKSLNTRIELIRQLYKGLYLLKYSTELIINTG
jgi:hypothetical protein